MVANGVRQIQFDICRFANIIQTYDNVCGENNIEMYNRDVISYFLCEPKDAAGRLDALDLRAPPNDYERKPEL
jgi:hypothetical protein